MPPTCTVCRLPNRQEAEEAILARTPLRNIAARHGTSPQALLRHREHLPVKLAKASEAREVASAESLTAKLQEIESEARRLGQKAEEAGDTRTALAAVRELTRLVELAARVQAARLQASGGREHISGEDLRKLLVAAGWRREEDMGRAEQDYCRDPAGFAARFVEKLRWDLAERSKSPGMLWEKVAELEAVERGAPNPGWLDALQGALVEAGDTLPTSRLALPPEPREIVAAAPPAPKQPSAAPAVIQTAPGPSLPKAVAGSIADSRLGRGAATIGRKPA